MSRARTKPCLGPGFAHKPLRLSSFGERYQAILELLADGHDDAGIAATLGIETVSVRGRIAEAAMRVGVRGRVPLVLWVLKEQGRLR